MDKYYKEQNSMSVSRVIIFHQKSRHQSLRFESEQLVSKLLARMSRTKRYLVLKLFKQTSKTLELQSSRITLLFDSLADISQIFRTGLSFCQYLKDDK